MRKKKRGKKEEEAEARCPSAKPEEGMKPGDGEEAGAAAPGETGTTGKAVEADIPTDRFLRLQADFDNFRKRTLREKQDIVRRANEDIVAELLPVLDHMELALEAAQKHQADPAFVQGFALVAEQLKAALGKFGLSVIDANGQPFDVNAHEAISYLPSPDHAEGTVISQTRKGYRLGDKLLRAAQVVVSSGPASPPESDAAPAGTVGGDPAAWGAEQTELEQSEQTREFKTGDKE